MPDTPESVVVVGGGLAGAKTAEALRDQGYAGPISLFTAEDELPYERPPLSKEYLKGEQPFADEICFGEDWYREHDVTLRRSTEVVAVHPGSLEVELADGSRVGYEALVLATGSEPRELCVPGGDAALTLRTHIDADAIKQTFGKGKRLVILGGGWIGLEVAAAARAADTDVTLLESAELPLLGVLGREMAEVFAELHREHNVDLRTNAQVVEVLTGAGGAAVGVRLEDDTELAADAVIAGIGAAPRLSLAFSGGLDTDDGVLVDSQLRTSEPAIFAVGDIASEEHPVLGRRVRVEHWANAQNQPAVAAAAILGKPDVYDRLPYFFSDQYDLGMEYVGLIEAGSYDRVLVRGDLAGREFVAFWLDTDNHILAAMNVNVWDVQDDIKPLIADRVVVDPDRLVDTDTPIADLR